MYLRRENVLRDGKRCGKRKIKLLLSRYNYGKAGIIRALLVLYEKERKREIERVCVCMCV